MDLLELKKSVDALNDTIKKACRAQAHVSGTFHEAYYGWWNSYEECIETGHNKEELNA